MSVMLCEKAMELVRELYRAPEGQLPAFNVRRDREDWMGVLRIGLPGRARPGRATGRSGALAVFPLHFPRRVYFLNRVSSKGANQDFGTLQKSLGRKRTSLCLYHPTIRCISLYEYISFSVSMYSFLTLPLFNQIFVGCLIII